MKKQSNKSRLKLSTALFKGSFVHNPVLTQLIGICPIIAAATRIRDAIALSVMLLILLCANEVLTSLLLKRVKRWLRCCIYTFLSIVIIALCEPLIFLIAGNKGAGLGIYLYLLCVNALIVIRCEKFACKTTALNSLFDAVAAAVGYGGVALIVAGIRELINYGRIFAPADALPRFSQTAVPFAALSILGFLAAFHKWILIKAYPDEIRDTFSMRAAFEKPVAKDPGILGSKAKPKTIKEYTDIRPRHFDEERNKDV